MNEKEIKRFKELYERKEHYGKNSIKFYDQIANIIQKNGYKNILDFGCGKSELHKELTNKLNVTVYRYDPAIEGLEKKPNTKFDFVICSDVLHNIEEKEIPSIIKELKHYSDNCFIYLNCVDHPTTFYDGTKTNRCVHSRRWWSAQLKKVFDNVRIININDNTKAMFEIGGKKMSKVKKAGCILVNTKDKTIALVFRQKQKDYSFPKGHVEGRETLKACALRETAEETKREGILLKERPIYVEEYVTPSGEDVRMYYFLAKDGGPSDNTCEDTHPTYWIPFDKVYETLSYPSLQTVWNAVKDKVESYFE